MSDTLMNCLSISDCEIAAAISVFENGKFVRMDDDIVTNTVNKISDVSSRKHSIKTYMGETMYKAVLPAVTDWAGASTDESLNLLERHIKRKIDSKKPDIRLAIEKTVEDWSNGIMSEIRKLEEEIQIEYCC